MTEHDEADRAVAGAKTLIASGDYWGALAMLRTAVETVPDGRADVLIGQIREAADDLAKGAPRYASAAQAIRDSVAGRVGVPSPRLRLSIAVGLEMLVGIGRTVGASRTE